jgi:surfeit locus 1 family protein
VLVDRGWLPLNAAAPEERSLFNGPGPVTVEGIAYQTQTRPGALTPLDKVQAGESRLDAWFRVDIDMIQQQIPYALLPVFVAQTNTLAAAPTDLPRPVGQVQLDEGPHLSYAVQWFSFALALVVIYGFFIRQELSN